MRGRLLGVVLCGVLAVAVFAASVTARTRRDREWAHGGDALRITAQLRTTDQAGLAAAVAALGGPTDPSTFLPPGMRALVLRLDWHGTAYPDGSYQVVVLDNEVSPPKPLRAYQGWSGDRGLGKEWDGRFDVLRDHYDWLRRLAGSGTDVFSLPAAADGTFTGVFWVEDPLNQPLVGIFLADGEAQPRWARTVTVR